MIIRHNLAALTAFNNIEHNAVTTKRAAQALATGQRINSAADDAAGLAISEKMRSQINGLNTAMKNTQDGISLLQTAEGALSSTTSILQRMRELSVQAANDTLTGQDRIYIQAEIEQLKDEINKISGTTQFNKKKLLNGDSAALWSSSDNNLKAIINGSLVSTDQFGQKINHEGNYKIEITSDPGKAQVQKSNIMPFLTTENKDETITYTKTHVETIRTFTEETVTITEEKEISIILDGGDNGEAISSVKEADNLDEITSGWDFDTSAKTLTIKSDGLYRITATNSMISTQNNIVVAAGVNAQIFLDGVNINTSSANKPAFEIEPGGKAEIFLANTNRLRSASGRAGIEVRGAMTDTDSIASVVINSANSSNSSSLDGVLEVTGGYQAAAIGGPGNNSPYSNGRSGSIEINGGTIIATGGQDAAGIGGGYTSGYNGGGTITINGGDVTAISPLDAGIGTGLRGNSSSGTNNDGTVITITGGRIKAKGGSGAGAGIGGGLYFDSGVIQIKSGITIMTDMPTNDADFLTKAAQKDVSTSGSFVYAVMGATSTAAIGHGKNAKDTEGAIDLQANISTPTPPSVPSLPTAEVTQTSVILHEEVEYIYTYEEITSEAETENKTYNTLQEISQFYNPSGVFIADPYQTITITQGNGKSADVILYSGDTLEEAAKKINDAIANDLGQGKYTDDASHFCNLAHGINNTSESAAFYESTYQYDYLSDDDDNTEEQEITSSQLIKSTLVVRSVVPGKEGELSFSGNDEILRALGFNTIQESTETTYRASIYNAHSGEMLASDIKVTGNIIHSVINPNVDLEFDSMLGIAATWDNQSRSYKTVNTGSYSGNIHLADNSIKFQIGANENENFIIDLGNMSSHALGLDGVNAGTRETASRSITIIDGAIDKISTQRAKIGTYINTLEHSLDVLTTQSASLTKSLSIINDADMARETLKFVKMSIINQTGIAVLSQANLIAENVSNLL
ncbi:MAG: hypothetical protein IJS99_08710 [Synergistaceae bacterium]|nr:hypothetical protein [Synergistaceae bacterium]